MLNSHAFTWVAAGWRSRVLLVVSVCTIAVSASLNRQGRPLREHVAGGIVAYEFAWTRERADAILTSWRDLRVVAERQLELDFAFLVLYPAALALGCALLSQAAASKFAAIGSALSYAVLVAAPLDAAENVALLRMLASGASATLAGIAGFCAVCKFTLVVTGLGYVVLQGLALLVVRTRTT